jgi:short-subunit dehydrogenase
MKVEGARVFVTGGNRGIGLAMAKAFSSAGAQVWIGVRNPAAPDVVTALSELPKGRAVRLDMSSRESIEESLPELLKLEIDILVNNAGQLTGGLLEEQSLDDIYQMFQVNLVGLAHLTHSMLPGMIARKRGKIVNNSSVSGVMNFPLASTYSAAKTGVIALTACIAEELRGTGVSTLTLVTPGVKTRMFDEIKVKYGSKLDLTLIEGAVEPEVWASEVVDAVKDDRSTLLPRGLPRAGLAFAKFLPRAFNSFVSTKFRRAGLN